MFKPSSNFYAILIMCIYAVAMMTFNPLPLLFLTSTLVVTSVAMIEGPKVGVISFLISCILIWIFGDIQALGISEILTRYVGFFITTFVLSFVSIRLRTLDRDLESKKHELASVVDSSDDAILSRSLDGTIKTWNKSAEKMFGYTEKEAVGQNIFIIVPDEYKHEEEDLIKTLQKGERFDRYETVRKRKDGSLVLVSLTVSPIKNSKGEFVAVAKIIRDVTEKKHKEEEILKAKERYEAFMQNSKDGIWRFELKEPLDIKLPVEKQIEWLYKYGYFAECNETMATMCELKIEDIVDKPLTFMISKIILSAPYLAAFVNKNYNLQNVESTERREDDVYHYFTTNLHGVVEDGKLLRGWGTQKDISAAKKYAIERESLLSEAKEAKVMADMANKEKDRVLADLSHELRTPLVSIVGYSEILNDKTPKEELKKGLEIINRNGKAQLQLIEDLLALSQVTSGKSKLNKEEFNLRELLKYRIDSLKYRYKAKNLEVIFNGDDLIVTADQMKVAQIFNNIFSNAIKFTNKGSITVEYGQDTSNSFYFSVKDTGIGISEKHIKKLFTPYYQADEGLAKSNSGVGLGLYITKTFTNLHKGIIEVNSVFGEGSVFKVSLPLNGNDLRLLDKTLEGTHILLVEDDDIVGELITLLLGRQGALVTWARSAEESDEILLKNNFDLYVFDIAMPKEDGISYIKRLRKANDFTPSVAISAYADYEEQALKQGFNLFILKPLSMDKMNEMKSVL